MRTSLILIISVLVNYFSLSAQTDVVSWSGFKIGTHIDEKTKFEVKPIVRNNNNLSSFQNASIDFITNRKIGKKWYVQNIYRHWLIPNAPRRNFIWFDVGYVTPLGGSKISSGSTVRLHMALDTGGQSLPDFIRVKQTFRFLTDKKVIPFIGLEAWYRYSSNPDFAGYRIEPGFIWRIGQGYSFSFVFRIQRRDSVQVTTRANHLVSTISYSF